MIMEKQLGLQDGSTPASKSGSWTNSRMNEIFKSLQKTQK